MWKSTDVDDALPAIICVAGITCLRSKKADELAAIDTAPNKSIALIVIDANSSAFFDLKQVVPATQIIAGNASSTSVDFHISGVEIS